MVRRLLWALLLLLPACALPPSPTGKVLGDVTLNRDQSWQGRVVIEGKVRLVNGASLTLKPGTEVLFRRIDRDRDGLGDGAIEIERGRLIAHGTPLAPVVFRSAEAEPRPGDWLELKVDFSRDIELTWCRIEDSAHGLHAHFSRGRISHVVLSGNIDGTRFGQGRYSIDHSLVTGNVGKGVNFRNSEVTLEFSLLVGNHTGLFIFETDRDQRIENNLFAANGFDVRLGDFFAGDLALGSNRFAGERPLEQRLYDRGEDASLGVLTAVSSDANPASVGPLAQARLVEDWNLATDGYVDATAVIADGVAVVGGWDGKVRAVAADGRLLWQTPVGDIVDAPAAVDGDRAFVQTWSRQVVALDRATGAVLWNHDYPASEQDDHRQGGLLRWRDLLLVPAWNGALLALDPHSGSLIWQTDIGRPLRSAPVPFAGGVLQASGSGKLSLVDEDGTVRWTIDLGQPLLSSPAVADSEAVILGREGRLACLDADGHILWQRQVAAPAWYGAPVVADGLVHAATGAGVLATFALKDGTPLWQVDLGAPVYATPAVVGPWLALADNGGTLRMVSRFDGKLVNDWRAGDAIQTTPVLFDGQLLFGSRDGRLHALRIDIPAQADSRTR
ncbi:MAG: hypothetical protein Tsb0017_15390 [Geothermobacteraceae bacterium]